MILLDIQAYRLRQGIHNNHIKVLGCHSQESSIIFPPNELKIKSKPLDLDIERLKIEAADTFLHGVTFQEWGMDPHHE